MCIYLVFTNFSRFFWKIHNERFFRKGFVVFDQIVSFSLDLDLFFTENQYLNAKFLNIMPNWRVEFDFGFFD